MQTSMELSIKQYLCREVFDCEDVLCDQDLINDGILDSLGLFLLLEFIETELGIAVAPEEVVFDNFSSIRTIADFVAARQTATG